MRRIVCRALLFTAPLLILDAARWLSSQPDAHERAGVAIEADQFRAGSLTRVVVVSDGIDASPHGAGMAEHHVRLDEIAALDPLRALSLADAPGRDERERHAAIASVVRRWAVQSPAAALVWCRQHDARWAGTGETGLVEVALRAVGQQGAVALVSLVQGELERPPQPNESSGAELAYAAVNFLLATEGSEAAAAAVERWSQAGVGDRIGEAALVAVGARWAEASPQDALNWLCARPVGDDRGAAVTAVAALWTARDPAGAVAWAERLPADAGRMHVLPCVVATWAQRDPAAAAEWAAAHEADPAADRIWASLAAHSPLPGTHPVTALRLAGLITDPGLRSASTAEILASWHAREPLSALNYLWSSALPPSEKAQLAQWIQTH